MKEKEALRPAKKKYLLIFFLPLLLLVILPFLWWCFQKPTELNVWVLDYTVPDRTYREHRGLIWTLNHFKIQPLEDQYFKYDQDYYGFFPHKDHSYTITDLGHAPDFPDLIYMADTYGVYEQEFMAKSPRGDRSPLIYGGFNPIDMFRVREFLRNGITLIGEFNTFASPTSEEMRYQLENILGVQWKEWMGRFFLDLSRDGEVAPWMVQNYENHYRKPWDYRGPGFVLTSNWDEIVVLVSGLDTEKNEINMIMREEFQDEFNIKRKIPYYYWFEFVQPLDETETIADFHLNLTREGKEKLSSIGLGSVFPAVTRYKSDDYLAYYFAGDFADHMAVPKIWKYAGLSTIRKMFSLDIKGEANAFFWRAYVPLMKKILADIRMNPAISSKKLVKAPGVWVEDNIKLISKNDDKHFYVYRNNEWEPIFIAAVNMGMAKPGKWSTEFPTNEFTYERWLKLIADMNANAVRVYTLMDPSFYRALYLYNLNHPQKPLYLLQGIWPEEHPPEDNYIGRDYQNEFLEEIRFGVDAIHGNIDIPPRRGRAWGRYVADCSSFTIAWLVGREFEPQEVEATNRLNPGYTYKGSYLQCLHGSPTEAWLTWACDQTLVYEVEKYGWERPVSFVSWPTLDPIEWDSEWNEEGDKSKEWNDWMSVDINMIDRMAEMKGGFFGSYHIYPNFPDFMNNELSFYRSRDEKGRFLYRGYLESFIQQHTRYPALVAEFGLATGMGNAHSNPDGYHHGAQTEIEQGEGTVRMLKNIYQAGYIGGVIFEWMDEWAKKTWTTEPFMIPFERQVFWHNTICPEQNYGILANESTEPIEPELVIEQKEWIERMSLKTDVSFLYIDLDFTMPPNLSSQELIVGIDTYDRKKGEFRYRENLELRAPSGLEFKLTFSNDKANLKVIPSYNIGSMRFQSETNYGGIFEKMEPLINKNRIRKNGSTIPEIRENASLMLEGEFTESRYHYHWLNEGKTLRIRLPWGRLNITDPSSHRVLDDPRKMNWFLERDGYQTARTDGFVITALLIDQAGDKVHSFIPRNPEMQKPFLWKRWEEPVYQERLKKSYPIIQQFLGSSWWKN